MVDFGAGLSSHSSQLSSFLMLLLEPPLLVLAAFENAISEGGGTVKGLPSTSALSLSLYTCAGPESLFVAGCAASSLGAIFLVYTLRLSIAVGQRPSE